MGLIVTDFAGGDAYAPSVEKCVDIAEHFLGAGATSGVSTWGDYHTLVNPIMTELGLSTISDGVTGATWVTRMNALNALGVVTSDAYLALEGMTDGFVVDAVGDSVIVRDTATPAYNFIGTMAEALAAGILNYPSPSTKYVRNPAGIWTPGTALRCHYSTAGEAQGLLSEPQRTNLLLNSAALATQSVTVSATAYTLSFEGTGTVTLSGASTAGPLVGTGATDRVSLTFTPSAGSLTLTVSGTVNYANLEAGLFRTSPIVTAGSTVTRNGDNIYVDLTKVPFSAAAYTLIAHAQPSPDTEVSGGHIIAQITDGTSANRASIVNAAPGNKGVRLTSQSGGVADGSIYSGSNAAAAAFKVAAAYSVNNGELVAGGASQGVDTSLTMPVSPTMLKIGCSYGTTNHWSAPIGFLAMIPERLSQADMIARTS